MARVQTYFENRFRALFTKLGVADPEKSARILFDRASELSREQRMPMSLTLARLHASLRQRAGESRRKPEQFVCDAGLGGLARWIRAAGYEASWNPELDDAGVIREAKGLHATLLTTDSMMMERGILRDGLVPSIGLPSTVSIAEQLSLVFDEMALPLRPSRCMKCGGELKPVEKELLRERIPPRTWKWRDEYFLCTRCDQLFWHGTHWQKIRSELETLGRSSERESRIITALLE